MREYENNCIGKIEGIHKIIVHDSGLMKYGLPSEMPATELELANGGTNPFTHIFYGEVPATYQGQVVSLSSVVEKGAEGKSVIKQTLRTGDTSLEPLVVIKTGTEEQLELIE